MGKSTVSCRCRCLSDCLTVDCRCLPLLWHFVYALFGLVTLDSHVAGSLCWKLHGNVVAKEWDGVGGQGETRKGGVEITFPLLGIKLSLVAQFVAVSGTRRQRQGAGGRDSGMTRVCAYV